MPQLFLSHQQQKKTEAKSILKNLEKRFIRVWLDENEISGSQHISKECHKAILDSQVFLAMITPEYLDSAICRMEFDIAVEQQLKGKIKIITVLMDDRKMLMESAMAKGLLQIHRAMDAHLAIPFNQYDPEKTHTEIAKAITAGDPVSFEPIRVETIEGVKMQVIELNTIERIPAELFATWDYNLEEFLAKSPADEKPIQFGLPVGFFNSRINWLSAHLAIPFKNQRSVFIYNNPAGFICVYALEPLLKGKVLPYNSPV